MNTTPIAFFDFDGTITKRDSLIPFLIYVRGKKFLYDLILSSPYLIGYASGLINNQPAKEALITESIGGMDINELMSMGEDFAKKHIPRILRVDMQKRVKWHQDQYHRCVLVSASMDIYLTPWAEQNFFYEVLSSSLDVRENGLITGRLKGKNCHGYEKVKRIESFLSLESTSCETYAYGDSKADIPMLSVADNSFWVKRCIIPYEK